MEKKLRYFRKSARKSFLVIVTMLFIISCKKSVTVPPPTDFVVSETIFQTDGTAIGAVTGIYSEMMNNRNSSTQFTASGITIYAGFCADELQHTQPNFSSRSEFINNQLNATIPEIATLFWDRAYKYIYYANACLEGLEKSTTLSPDIKNKLKGECYFIRAFCYFYLVNLFGDVPLVVVADYRVNMNLPRESSNKVYDKIVDDLVKAEILLPEEYDLTGGAAPKTRPNKKAATAMLARVFLYKKDWVNAELKSTEVIGSGNFQLKDNPETVFSSSTPEEVIWQLSPVVSTANTWEGNLLLPPVSPTAQPGYILTSTLLNSFETGDERYTSWIAPRLTYFFPNKYKIKTISPPAKEFYVVLRLAEQYLIRAEARAQRNNLDKAVEDINTIRDRAGLDVTSASTQEEILLAIEEERRVELFAEWGHRWFDLKRTNRADTVLRALKTTWESADTLWPIPSDQIRLNAALVQNQGY